MHDQPSENPFLASSETKEQVLRPEWIANPPLENTTLVFSVPVCGEWKNGYALRMLHAMFSQKIEKDQAVEIELVANLGGIQRSLFETEEGSPGDRATENFEALDKRQQTQDVIDFVKILVEIQALAREVASSNKKQSTVTTQRLIDEKIASVQDPIQQDVLRQAAKRSREISVSLLDTTKMDFSKTPYRYESISSARTIGIDGLMARFASNEDVAVSMFDVDTIPLDGSTVRDIQRLYDADPKLSYLFYGMSDSAKGVNRDIASNPTLSRHVGYNAYDAHGGPQQSFRLRAYRKLKEIASFQFHGDEDRDTGVRLIYHFGEIQAGLLLETSRTITPSSPRVLTADRKDGFMDGRDARSGANARELYGIENDVSEVMTFQDETMGRIQALPERDRNEALEVLQQARKKEVQREKVQQRMNRLVVRSFFQALEKGLIFEQNGTVAIDETKIAELQAGKALRFFLRMNPVLFAQVLSSPDDLLMMKYYAGIVSEYPEHIAKPTHFQAAMRDYLGEVVSCDEMVAMGVIEDRGTIDEKTQKREWKDCRTPTSRVSALHGMTAELLALGHTHRVFFQTDAFFEHREGRDMEWEWPKKKEEQRLDYHFGSLEDRVKALRDQLDDMRVQSTPTLEQPRTQSTPDVSRNWYQRISLRAVPAFEFLKRMLV